MSASSDDCTGGLTWDICFSNSSAVSPRGLTIFTVPDAAAISVRRAREEDRDVGSIPRDEGARLGAFDASRKVGSKRKRRIVPRMDNVTRGGPQCARVNYPSR